MIVDEEPRTNVCCAATLSMKCSQSSPSKSGHCDNARRGDSLDLHYVHRLLALPNLLNEAVVTFIVRLLALEPTSGTQPRQPMRGSRIH